MIFRHPGHVLLFAFALAVSASCALIGGGDTSIRRARGYTIVTPEQWTRTNRAESDRAYRLPSGNVVTLTSSCQHDSSAPLDVLTRHLLIGTRDVRLVSRSKERIGAYEGLYSKVEAKLDNSKFHLELFVLSRQACVFDFSLVSPRPITESDSRAYKQWIASFRYGKD